MLSIVSIIKKIRQKLEKFPEIVFDAEQYTMSIYPLQDSGFTISIAEVSSTYTVAFDGWHESFDSEEDALSCVAFGLSDSCRLKTIFRGSTPQKWVVEYKENGDWVMDSETGLMFFRFGGKSEWFISKIL